MGVRPGIEVLSVRGLWVGQGRWAVVGVVWGMGVAGLILCVCVDQLAGIMWTGVLRVGLAVRPCCICVWGVAGFGGGWVGW